MNDITLSDEKIILRPYTLEDIEEHLAGEDEEQIRWLSGGKGTYETTKKWILKNLRSWDENGPIFNYAIIENSSNKLVGKVEANSDYKNIEALKKGDANISYVVFPVFSGMGYAIRAIKLILDYLQNKGFKRGIIRVDPENTNCLKVPEKLGFTRNNIFKTKKGEVLIIFIKILRK